MIPSPFTLDPTLAWLARAAQDPAARHPQHLPETLDFSAHAELFQRIYHSAVPTRTEMGFPVVLREGGLYFPPDLAAQARYRAFQESGQLLGTFHVHPPDRPPFFDPQDLASTLRSDNPGFIELLLARDRLMALVRANPYLYISAHHVNRNPLLLQETHTAILRRKGSFDPEDPRYAEQYRAAGLYYFHRYGLALYEGEAGRPLRRSVTPEGNW